ncbi:UNKNOWN [Stylonychia lemnae]|uniref:Uncharacterized protein n=1 Tax=Stylonychia lemnae TaxID=5949 RepID=A0A078B2Y5_STYLE|nr:UNKNOWN [Stylonychia lemnae]|eukprot:CDW88611.1 UNKNOWN [Stylonychia lemnae]
MEQGIDTVGEHFVQASFMSEQFEKEFSFFVKVVIRSKKGAKESVKADQKKKASEGGSK